MRSILKNTLSLKFTLLQFLYLLSNGAIFGYASALFLHSGIEVSKIGVICAIETGCSFVGFIILGGLCNRIHKIKTPVVVFISISIIAYTLMFFCTSTPFLPLFYGLIGFIYDPVTALLDTWIIGCCPSAVKSYARIRMISLLVYAAFFIFFSMLISRFSYIVCLIVVLISLTLCLFLAMSLPDIPSNAKTSEAAHGQKESGVSILSLIRDEGRYMGLFLTMLLFIGICCTSLLTMVPVILEEVGGDIFYQGVGLFLCYAGDSLFTLYSVKLYRMNVLWRCVASVLCMALGLFALMLFPGVGMILAATLLRGVSNGLLTVSMRQYVSEYVPERIQTLSHSLCTALYASLGGTIGITVVTKLYSLYGIAGMTLFCSASGAAAIALCGLIFIRNRRLAKAVSKSDKMFETEGI